MAGNITARILEWLTDAALADSVLGDLYCERRRRGVFWFWRAVAGVIGYAAWARVSEAAFGGAMRNLPGDVHQALKSVRRRPGFTVCAALFLALGIGANTAVFSIVHAVMLRPLPYADVERLVFVWKGRQTAPGNMHGILTGQHAIAIQQATTTIESFALVKAWQTGLDGQVDLILPDGAERLRGAQVTSNFFELLGVGATTGRTFATADGDAPLAVISDGLWRRRFAAASDVVGRQVSFAPGRSARGDVAYTIVGVLPAEFRFTYPRDTDVYLLFPWSRVDNGRALEFQMVARLKPGATIGQSEAELTTVLRNVSRTYSNIPAEMMDAFLAQQVMLVEPVTEHLQAEVRPGLLLLAAIALLVLVIACVNLALLMLARMVDRRGELGLRAALGASTGRIVAQLTAEAAVLSLCGGAIALLLVAALAPAIRSVMPPMVPRADQIGIDPVVLGFAALLMAVTTIVCGVGPACIALRRDLIAVVRSVAPSSTGDRAIVLVRRAIVTLQVAVVVLLLVGSSLLIRSFWRLQHVDLGFRADDVITMEIRLLNPKYQQRGQVAAFHEALLTRVRAIPGVARAGITTAVPMRGVDFLNIVGPKDGRPVPGNMRSVDPDFFRVMQLRLLAGRLFDTGDTAASTPVAVVSESYARKAFGAVNPVGQVLALGRRDATVVGVVGDVRYADAAREPGPAFYVPTTQQPVELICLVVEPQPGATASVIASLRPAVKALDPEQPVEGLTTIREIVSAATADRRFYALSTGAFASVALLLAIAGVFGVVSRTVTEKRRELAIRVALGASPRRLVRLVFAYGVMPAAIGAVAGLAGAFAGSRLLRRFLFEIAPNDIASYAAAAALVVLVTVVACYVPARRTLRLAPMAVLKSD
jgi:putative ABC transport system permease protein